MADEYYKGVKLIKGKYPRKNYFQQKFLRQFKSGIISAEQAHEKMVITGTTKTVATSKIKSAEGKK
jgi:hypothetical protein|tara:strand:- start:328 stop:525 length:198 start_codon:yes stop_codon:yes gene_type:complete